MQFVIYSDKDFSQRKTLVYELELLSIDSGELEGEKYFKPIREQIARPRYAHLPENILQDEFLNLDPNDEGALLDFQCEYGQIAAPPFFDIRSGWSNFVFTERQFDDKHVFRFEGDTNQTTVAINKYLKKTCGELIRVISLNEVQETVTALQNYIRATTRAKQGIESIWDEESSEDFVLIANNLKKTYYPSYGVLGKDQDPNLRDITMPLIPNLIFMQMAALASDRPYYKCEVCGKLKQYARRQPKPGERHYCSEACRLLDKSRRQNQRRRAAKKGERDGEE